MSDCHIENMGAGICSTQSRRLTRIAIAMASLLVSNLPATSRAEETLFNSSFEQGSLGQPPSHNQDVGTVTIWGPPHSVLLERDSARDVAMFISRRSEPDEVGLRAQFSHTRGYGIYSIAFVLKLKRLSAAGFKATLDFEPRHQEAHPPSRFLRIEFLPDGRLRFDENNATSFGQYTYGSTLVVTMKMNVNPTLPNVQVDLFPLNGVPESIADYNIQKPLRELAQEFGAITMSIGPHQIGQIQLSILWSTYCNC
jgi:hypothetical protein